MKIRLLFFSVLRDIAGTDEVDYSLQKSTVTVADLLTELFSKYEGLSSWDASLLVAVNCEYADRDREISAGDEVALMPPVQGG